MVTLPSCHLDQLQRCQLAVHLVSNLALWSQIILQNDRVRVRQETPVRLPDFVQVSAILGLLEENFGFLMAQTVIFINFLPGNTLNWREFVRVNETHVRISSFVVNGAWRHREYCRQSRSFVISSDTCRLRRHHAVARALVDDVAARCGSCQIVELKILARTLAFALKGNVLQIQVTLLRGAPRIFVALVGREVVGVFATAYRVFRLLAMLLLALHFLEFVEQGAAFWARANHLVRGEASLELSNVPNHFVSAL